ncbi:MAG: VCBS repeat-containing protein [Flavobacteriales bacterium]|nr:VCBS repeat-containing protein [Flavobacteriales bacterium]
MRPLYLSIVCFLLLRSANAQLSCASPASLGAGTTVCAGLVGTDPPTAICTVTAQVADHAIWYVYQPTADHLVTISTEGSGVDTRLHVLTGPCDALSCVAGNDDAGSSGTSEVQFNAEEGAVYLVVFDDLWSAAGFAFQLTEGEPQLPPVGPVVFTATTLPQPLGAVLTVVDMDGDHLDDIVSAGSTSIQIARQVESGPFEMQAHAFAAVQHAAGFSVAAGDMDNNGRTDLLYGGGGPTFMLADDDGQGFTEWSNDTYLFAQRTNMADIDNDGFLDGFYCHDFGTNHYYFSDGQGGFTEGSGELSVLGGNYGSIWIDFDGDGDVDMYNTKCGGGNIDELYRNDGDAQFTDVAPEMGFADATHQAWSTAWGDYDSDGDLDAFVGRSGSAAHKLMRNDGDVFTDMINGSGAEAAYNSIEWRTHDFNNDGHLDILGNSQLLYGMGDLSFSVVPAPMNGPIGDLNNDGFLDMITSNSIYFNNGNENHWLKVALEGTISNRMGVGARVTVITPQGGQIRDIISGDGCRYMSTLNAHFGLGSSALVEEVRVHWPSGVVDVIASPVADGTLTVVEGVSTGSGANLPEPNIRLAQDPVVDQLRFLGVDGITSLRVLDATGRLVSSEPVLRASHDVSMLPSGVYSIVLIQGTRTWTMPFVKVSGR